MESVLPFPWAWDSLVENSNTDNAEKARIGRQKNIFLKSYEKKRWMFYRLKRHLSPNIFF